MIQSAVLHLRPRDALAALLLFASTAAVVLWQNAHVAVLWDLSYVLDTAARIAHGQIPYRDFPLAHAPLTFLIHAAIIRLTGRVFFHHALYAALAGGLGSVLAWRIALRALTERLAPKEDARLSDEKAQASGCPIHVRAFCGHGWESTKTHSPASCSETQTPRCPTLAASLFLRLLLLRSKSVTLSHSFRKERGMNGAHRDPYLRAGSIARKSTKNSLWWTSLALAVPLAVLGLYCIFPHPSYDCDAMLAVLLALFLLQRAHTIASGAAAGAALVLPLLAKQNIGLPFLAVTLALAVFLLTLNLWRKTKTDPSPRTLASIVAGALLALLAAAAALHGTAGLGNVLHWTVGFAAQRRMPGLSAMASIYGANFLLWALPCTAMGIALLRPKRTSAHQPWILAAAFLALAAPWLVTLASLLLSQDSEARGDALLALWPLVLLCADALMVLRIFALFRSRNTASLARLLPLAALAALHGALMSQQLWGSTYALWPLFVYLLAELLSSLPAPESAPLPRGFLSALACTASLVLLLCGGFYTVSEERISYADLDGAPLHSAHRSLAGLSTPGPYLENFDELLHFVEEKISPSETILLLPGEDPFYFATGRQPRFPVLLFDPATDPYSPEGLAAEVRRQHVRWLIVKRALQIDEDPMPNREASLGLLLQEFTPEAQLRGYDVYRRTETAPFSPNK